MGGENNDPTPAVKLQAQVSGEGFKLDRANGTLTSPNGDEYIIEVFDTTRGEFINLAAVKDYGSRQVAADIANAVHTIMRQIKDDLGGGFDTLEFDHDGSVIKDKKPLDQKVTIAGDSILGSGGQAALDEAISKISDKVISVYSDMRGSFDGKMKNYWEAAREAGKNAPKLREKLTEKIPTFVGKIARFFFPPDRDKGQYVIDCSKAAVAALEIADHYEDVGNETENIFWMQTAKRWLGEVDKYKDDLDITSVAHNSDYAIARSFVDKYKEHTTFDILRFKEWGANAISRLSGDGANSTTKAIRDDIFRPHLSPLQKEEKILGMTNDPSTQTADNYGFTGDKALGYAVESFYNGDKKNAYKFLDLAQKQYSEMRKLDKDFETDMSKKMTVCKTYFVSNRILKIQRKQATMEKLAKDPEFFKSRGESLHDEALVNTDEEKAVIKLKEAEKLFKRMRELDENKECQKYDDLKKVLEARPPQKGSVAVRKASINPYYKYYRDNHKKP